VYLRTSTPTFYRKHTNINFNSPAATPSAYLTACRKVVKSTHHKTQSVHKFPLEIPT